jgi:hypothetical protein
MGEPEEVSRLIMFLAIEESSYSTGSDLIDGGSLAGPSAIPAPNPPPEGHWFQPLPKSLKPVPSLCLARRHAGFPPGERLRRLDGRP